MPQFTKEITITDGIYHTIENKWNNGRMTTTMFTAPDEAYRYAFLPKDAVVRFYRIPNAMDDNYVTVMGAIKLELKEFEPTMCWVNKDTSFVAIKIPGKSWGDVGRINIAKMTDNVPKRLGMTCTPTYLNTESENVVIVEEGNYLAHSDDVVSVMYIDAPAENSMVADGVLFMRPELRDRMIAEFEGRCVNREKRDRLSKKFSKIWRYNFRSVMANGNGKGDVMITQTIADLPADIVLVREYNEKAEVNCDAGIIIQMDPREQKTKSGRVFTNPQTVSSHADWLFTVPHAFGERLIFDALDRNIERVLDDFHMGVLPPHILEGEFNHEEDEIGDAYAKMRMLHNAGLNLRDSLYLSMMYAGGLENSLTIDSDDEFKARRFPVPHAWRVTLTNQWAIGIAIGERPHVKRGEFYIDSRYGIVLNDADYVLVARILGGADGDDKVEVHFRRSMTDGEFYLGEDRFVEIETGDMIAAIIRNPIGVAFNKAENLRGTEYAILKPSKSFADTVLDKEGELPYANVMFRDDERGDLLPGRPHCITEIGELEQTWTPVKGNPPTEYTKKFFWDMVLACSQSQFVYGKHALMMSAAMMHNIQLEYRAPEECYIDSTTKSLIPANVNMIDSHNAADKLMFQDADLDPVIAARLGLEDDEFCAAPGIATEMVEYHAKAYRVFFGELRVSLQKLRKLQHIAYAGSPIGRQHPSDRNVPAILATYNDEEKKFLAQTKKKYLGSADLELVGRRVVTRLKKNVDSGVVTRDEVIDLVVVAYNWAMANSRPSMSPSPHMSGMFFNTDKALTSSTWMLRILLEGLGR